MTDNPFVFCEAEERNGKWFVASNYWAVPCASESSAIRLVEIIQAAYKSGHSDARTAVRLAIDGADVH